MATTPAGVVYPPLTNAPNVPADMQALANSIDQAVIPKFANAAARAAAITAPVDGQITYNIALLRHEKWAATLGTPAWVPLGAVHGNVSAAFSASTASTAVAVTFPTAYPAGAVPDVVLTATAITGNTPVTANITVAPTVTGFTARAFTGASFTGSVTVYWTASYA